MRLTRMSIEAVTLLYLLTYLPYMLITRALSTMANPQMGRPLTGLEVLPSVLIMGSVALVLFIWLSGWWRSARLVTVGGVRFPWPTKWTALSGIGTSFLLFTVPLSLTINGETRSFAGVGDLAALVAALGLDARKVSIERNLEIVPRSAYLKTRLADGDRIEIVHFIGGG